MVKGRRLLPGSAPALAGGVAAATLALAPEARAAAGPWLPATILGSLVVAALLALALRRSRGLWAVLTIGLAFDVARRWASLPGEGSPAAFAWAATALGLPVLLAVLVLGRDRPLWTGAGLGCGALVAAAPLLGGFVWLSFQKPLIDAILHEPAGTPTIPVRLTTAGWVAVAAASLTVLVRFLKRRTAFEGSVLGALWLATAGLGGGPGSGWLPPLLAVGALVVLIGMARSAFELAFLDSLTGLPGRRALEEDLRGMDGQFVAAMVDVDHFKKVNDAHGHEVGDQVLRMVASRLALVGGGGRAYRYGGEEFTLLFPGRRLAEAVPHVEAVREAIAATPFVLRGDDRPKRKPSRVKAAPAKPALAVTVSAGVAEGGRDGREAALKAADAALYRAKQAGRNRISR